MLGVVAEMRAIEARQALRHMKPDERLKVLHDAVETGDAMFASAVISASTNLSGISAAEQLLVRDYWQRTHHADTLARVRRLRDAQSELDRLGHCLRNGQANLFGQGCRRRRCREVA